jgi:hypothetical protein
LSAASLSSAASPPATPVTQQQQQQQQQQFNFDRVSRHSSLKQANNNPATATTTAMPYIYNSASISSTHTKSNKLHLAASLASSTTATVIAGYSPVARSSELDSQEDLRVLGGADSSAMSPMSSVASSHTSPRPVAMPAVNPAHQFIIPTRFVDRRVSTSVAQSDPYRFNVNYSEAGQRLARKAQEQLKVVEKVKDTAVVPGGDLADTSKMMTSLNGSRSISGSRRNSTEVFASNNNSNNSNDTSEFGEDWQYVRMILLIIHMLSLERMGNPNKNPGKPNKKTIN